MYLFYLGILPFLSEEITHHNIGPLILRYPNLPKNINDTKDLPLAILMEGNIFQRIIFFSIRYIFKIQIQTLPRKIQFKTFHRGRSFKERRIFQKYFSQKCYWYYY